MQIPREPDRGGCRSEAGLLGRRRPGRRCQPPQPLGAHAEADSGERGHPGRPRKHGRRVAQGGHSATSLTPAGGSLAPEDTSCSLSHPRENPPHRAGTEPPLPRKDRTWSHTHVKPCVGRGDTGAGPSRRQVACSGSEGTGGHSWGRESCAGRAELRGATPGTPARGPWWDTREATATAASAQPSSRQK